METIQLVQRRPNARKLVIPEPKQLWIGDPRENKRVVIEAKRAWAEFRAGYGFVIPKNVNDLYFGTLPTENMKYGKSEELIFGLSLAQSNLSGINVCHWSSPECRACCVGKNGNNGFPIPMRAKIAKTRFLFENPKATGVLLADFWSKAQQKGVDLDKEVGGRLNTYSDINWIEAAPWIFERFWSVHFYDYTKQWDRVSPFENYHLTYSADERTTDDEIIDFVSQGKNVAVVFSDWRFLPSTYLGFTVVDGDKNDVRWKDASGVIVGLKRKGKLGRTSPMVRAA